MSDRSASLLAAALRLSEEERTELTAGLLDSLDPAAADAESLTEDELIAELDRRADEMRRDPDAGIPWEQIQDMR
jgi:putative addiction module component (TIGR02574 family)